jgi:uncharacterized protein (TIGR02996 family)
MSDEDALLAAIAAHPDEDTPRLMYADWLDEHGRPLRAEFIRVQIEVARKEERSFEVLQSEAPLFRRNDELIEKHGRTFFGPLAAHGIGAVRFYRGFVWRVELRAELFLELAPVLAAVRPLPHVYVTSNNYGENFVENEIPDAKERFTQLAIRFGSPVRL